jgi:hypothetical protein
MNEMLKSLLDRLPASATSERGLIIDAFGVVENIRTKAAELAGDHRLSDAGRSERLKELASGSPRGHMRQLAARAKEISDTIESQRAKMQLAPPDKSDLRAELARQEIRAFLRGVNDGERFRLAAESPEIAEAVIHALPQLSGFTPDRHAEIHDREIQRQFGPQLKMLEPKAEVADQVSAALSIAGRMFLEESGLTEADLK